MLRTLQEVEEFFSSLIQDHDLAFHPDDDFSGYVNLETGESTFDTNEAATMNAKMTSAFAVCDNEGVDIYDVAWNVLFSIRPPYVAAFC